MLWYTYNMQRVIQSVLFFATLFTTCKWTYTIPTSSVNVQCTFLNVASSKNGGTAVAEVDGSHIDCPYLINDDFSEDVADAVSTNKVDIQFTRPYIVDTLRITESNLGVEAHTVKLTFSDGSKHTITMAALSRDTEEFSFMPRSVSGVTVLVKEVYGAGLTYFNEIELYYNGCQKELICDHFDLDPSLDSTPPYVLGDFFTFIKTTAADMTLQLNSTDQSISYTVRLDGDVSLLDSDAKVVAGPVAIVGNESYPTPFWVDLRSGENVSVGIGSTVIIEYHTGQLLASGSFALSQPISSSQGITLCTRKAPCYGSATHYLALDKFATKVVYDANDDKYGTIHGSITLDTDGPPLVSGKRLALHLQDGSIDLSYVTGCLTNLALCTRGMSFSIWLKINSLSLSTGYYLTGGLSSFGFSIVSPLPSERMVSGNEVEVLFQTASTQWRASISCPVGEWHHIACSWKDAEELICVRDFVAVEKGMKLRSLYSFQSLTLGQSASVPLSAVNASFSNLALWDTKLTVVEFQNLYYCTEMDPVPVTSSPAVKLSDDSFTASSFTDDGAPYLSRPSLGGWKAGTTDAMQFLQIDFFFLMEIHSLEITGNPVQNMFVTKFSLSTSDNLVTWTPYEDPIGTTKEFIGNTDSSTTVKIDLNLYIKTRYLRLHALTYSGGVSLKLTVFGSETDVNYEGCYRVVTSIPSEVLSLSDSIPYECNLVCGNRGKSYALVSKGGNCHCVDTVKTDDAISDLFCQEPCKTKPLLKCGGERSMAAYTVMEKIIRRLEISAPFWTTEGEAFNLTMSSTENTTSFHLYSDHHVTSTTQTSQKLSFLRAGVKSLQVEATVGHVSPEDLFVQQSVVVAVKARHLNLTCPPLVVTSESYDCVLEGYAGRGDVFTYIIDGVPGTNSLTLPQNIVSFVGTLHHPSSTVIDKRRSGLLFVSSFVEEALITSIHIHARKSGYLAVQVYRPVCGTGPLREYCDLHDSCTYFHPLCDRQVSYTCSEGGNLLHLPSGSCLKDDTCAKAGKPPAGFIPKKYQKYELIYENLVFVDVGTNNYQLEEVQRARVMESDVLAVLYPTETELSPIVSVEDAAGNEAAINHVQNFNKTTLGDYIEVSPPSQVAKENKQHSIKVWYFTPQTALLPITFPSGIHSVNVALENSISKAHLSQSVIAAVPISGLQWISGSIIATHDDYVISVQATMGVNVTYLVKYGDGNEEKFFQEEAGTPVTFTHKYTSPGYYVLEFSAVNYFSDEFSWHTVLIQDYIKDVNLSSPIEPRNLTNTTVIPWFIDSGSRVTLEFDLGDGTTFRNESLDFAGVEASLINHIYSEPIEYWVNITAYNLVNRIELYTMLIVEKPIVGLKSRVIHANRDIEVNESFVIELTQETGTNVIHHFEFKDTSTLLTRDTNITKNYTYWDVFPVNIIAWNNVSRLSWIQNIKVHKPVRDLVGFVITTSPTNHTDDVRFDFDMEIGSDFNCAWDYDDGLTGQTSYWISDSEVYKWPITHHVVHHRYAGIGVYNVSIHCENRLYTTAAWTISIVQVPISQFFVNELPNHPNDKDLIVDFGAATGTNITYNVTFYHSWDKEEISITNVTITPSTLSGRAIIPKELFMDRVAYYEVRVTAINFVTPLNSITRRVVIDRPIRNQTIRISNEFVETNVTVNYTIFADASNVTIEWDFDDPYAADHNAELTKFFLGVFPAHGWTVNYKYAENGFYTLKVKLTNSLGENITPKKLILQHGVYVDIVTDSPRPLPPGRMNFTFIPHENKEYPTDANMTVVFGDGQTSTGPYNITFIHHYESWGFFYGNVTIRNKVSFGFVYFKIEIQRTIQGLVLTPFHSAGDAGYFGPARGPNKDHLPLEYDVIWNVTVLDGTNITYTFDFGDGDTFVTKNATVRHRYRNDIVFHAKVDAKNSVSEGKATKTVTIQKIVRGLSLTSNCPRKLGDPTEFTVSIDQIGTGSCYLLKFGNNSADYLFKATDKTKCEDSFVEEAEETSFLTGNVFNQSYTYGFIDVYAPRLIGSNYVSKTWTSHKAVVVHDHCRYPVVNIFNIGKTPSTAQKILKSTTFVIDTRNEIVCDASKTTSFKWEIFSISENQYKNDTEFIVPSSIVTTNARFRVALRTFPYGAYKARFTITMLGIRGVFKHDEGYFNVTESSLIAKVHGGTGLAKGIDQNVTLNASQSQDPDVGPGRYENMTASWTCEVVSHPAEVTADQAGCGINTSTQLQEGNAEDLVALDTSFAKLPDCVYSLKLMLVKNHRRISTYFTLHTYDSDRLPVFVSCKDNCNTKRIAALKMVYESGIKDIDDPKEIKQFQVKWELYKAEEMDDNGPVQRIIDKNWEEVSDFGEMLYTSVNSSTLSIKEKMLMSQYRYRLRLHITYNGQQGFAEDELYMNKPPYGGSCSIDNEEGYAAETKFVVKCDGWEDVDLPIKYSFAYQVSPGDLAKVIYFGTKSVSPAMVLPVGNSSLNNTISIIVKTADGFQAATTVLLNVTVKSRNMSAADFIKSRKEMLSLNGTFANDIASGNFHGVAGQINSIASEFDSRAAESAAEPQMSLADLPEIDSLTMTAEEIAAIERQRKEIEEHLRKKEEEKQASIEMRDDMIKGLSQQTGVDSVEHGEEIGAALSSISNTPTEVTQFSQDQILKIVEGITTFLGNSADSDEPFDPSAIVNGCRGILYASGNVADASSGAAAEKLQSNETLDEGINGTQGMNSSKNTISMLFQYVDVCAEIVAKQKFPGEPPTEVNSPRLTMTVQRVDPSSIADKPASSGGGQFQTPDAATLFNLDGNDTDNIGAVDTKVLSNINNPFAWSPTSAQIKSKVMTMEMRRKGGEFFKIANLSKPIDMWVPRENSVDFDKFIIVHSKYLYRAFHVAKNDTSIQVEIRPEDNNTELLAYIRFGQFPREDRYDFKFLVPRMLPPEPESINGTSNKTSDKRQPNPFIFFISNEDLNRTAAGKYYIGVKYNGTFEQMYEPKIAGEKITYVEYTPVEANFTMRTFTSSCLYWDAELEEWSTEGCNVGPLTAMEGTQCLCNHLTSFGGDMVVAPNTIDWSSVNLDNLLSNPVVFAVVLSFILLYLILLIPARRQDKKDLEKLGVVPLPDNDPRDNYAYEVTVYTGFSAQAGTTANVYFILKGSQDETPVRLMKDPNKDKISVGSINYYLLTVPSTLGKLKSIRIWHDNGGSSPSWYLLRIMVHDLHRDTKTWFLCDRWLAVEEDDGEIERNLSVANSEDLTRFNLLFQTEARKNLSDGHIWFSVVRRPARSHFTRVQRLSCCLCILLTTMLANAMFYQKDPSTKGDGVLVIGPITLSLQQLSIAITSSMVVLPVNLFVVWIFRNARPKLPKGKSARGGRKSKADPKKSPSEKKGKSGKKKKSTLPHWMIYVAYGFIFIACSVSAAFTVFYGLTFGKAKSEAWITAMMISFWQDVLISQPLKVFAAATLFAMLTKDPKKATGEDEEDAKQAAELQDDEEFATNRSGVKPSLMVINRPDPHPPDAQKLKVDREVRLKQKQMKYIIYDIVWYFVFVCVLLSVAYGNKDTQAYDVTSTMSSLFEDNSYTGWIPLSEVTDPKLFWYWSRYSLLPTLIPNQWYGPNLILENAVWVTSDSQISRSRGARSRLQLSSTKLLKLQGRPGQFPDVKYALNGTAPFPESYVADRATDYTVGVARFRQLRIKPNQCPVHPVFKHIFTECNDYYSWEKEDEGYYSADWQAENNTSNGTETKETIDRQDAWKYRTAWDLKGTPYWAAFSTYWGGGYVAELGHNETLALNRTKYLQESNWLDRYTRAIFIEFTLYNPNVNLFCVVTLLTEVIPTGGYYQFNQIYPMRLYRYFGSNLLAIMILEITLMTFLLYFCYREFKKWRREGRLYWRDIWTYMELLVLASCFSTVGLYFARMVATKYSIGLMREDPTQYVSFHYAVSLDDWATFTLGMAVFFAFLKTLRLLRFNRRMSVMGTSITMCAKPLLSFSIVYAIVFLSYAMLGYLVFGRVSLDYHTFHSAMANILGMTLGAFNFQALVDANSIIGPVFFFTFTFVVNFILINVFVAIICEALATVTSDVCKQSKDHEMFDFMMHQVKQFIGYKVSPAVEPIYREPLPELEAKFDHIEKNTEKAELALRNMCMEEIRQARWFNPDNCSSKKKLLLRLLLQIQDDVTEADICDSIPLLDEVMQAYTERDMKEWLGEDISAPKSCQSSMFISRTSFRDSDDSDDRNTTDNESDTESLCEARWSQLSGEQGASTFLGSNLRGNAPTSSLPKTAECYYREDERPPSTAERFCRTETTISMTSLNNNMAVVDRLFLENDEERLYVEAHEVKDEGCHEMGRQSLDERFGIETSLSCNNEGKTDGKVKPPKTAWKSNIDLNRSSRKSTPSSGATSASPSSERTSSFSPTSGESTPDKYMTIEDLSD